jgi:hypothetical protein
MEQCLPEVEANMQVVLMIIHHTEQPSILKHYNATSDVTNDNSEHVDKAFFTVNDSHNNTLKFGTPYAEHTVYLNTDWWMTSVTN